MKRTLSKYSIYRTLLLLILWIYTDVNAQNKNSFVQDSLDQYINDAMTKWNIPGLAVAITKDDRLVYSKGFGIANVDIGNKVDENTLFPIWSMGKSFTAFSLALLEQRNQLHLDDLVKHHYQNFKMDSKDYENELTLIDVLAHRMGVETFQGDFLWSESPLTTAQLLDKWAHFKPRYPMRSGFQYSNYGYLIAGQVLESVGKKTWQTFLTDEILKPLGMNRSTLLEEDLKTNNNVSSGHTKIQGTIKTIGAMQGLRIEPFGGMYSSIHEMIVWIQLHLNKGIINGKRIFAESIFDRVHQSYNSIGKMYLPDGSNPLVNYELGWEVRDYYGKKVITHGGSYHGFLTMMGFVPQEKLGFVILTNSDAHELTESLKWQIVDAYRNQAFKNHVQPLVEYTQREEIRREQWLQVMLDSVAQKIKPTIPLKRFEGSYQNKIYGIVQVKLVGDDTLELKFEHHPLLTASLKHIGDNRFFCEYSNSMFGKVVIPFEEKNNTIISFELSVDPLVEFTTYQFLKCKDGS